MNTSITAIIFDFGNVFVNWDAHRVYEPYFPNRKAIDDFLSEIRFHEWNACQDAGRPFHEGVRELSNRFPHHQDLIQAYDTHWVNSITGTNDETIQIAKELKQAGWPLYLLSNFSMEKFRLIQHRYDFLNIFDDLIISGEHGLVKPDPAIFHLTLRKINRPAHECLFIDDSLANIETAGSIGFQTIHYQSPAQLKSRLKKLNIIQGNPA